MRTAKGVKTWRLYVVAMIVLTISLWPATGSSEDEGDAARGKKTFTTLCGSCHGSTGKGDGPAAAALSPKPKDFTNKDYVSKLDDNYLSDIIARGGASVGKSALMPPFGASLKDDDIRNVIAYIRSLGK
ncbi:MAG: c-type cytochrome [Candidatus Binatia bacterium]